MVTAQIRRHEVGGVLFPVRGDDVAQTFDEEIRIQISARSPVGARARRNRPRHSRRRPRYRRSARRCGAPRSPGSRRCRNGRAQGVRPGHACARIGRVEVDQRPRIRPRCARGLFLPGQGEHCAAASAGLSTRRCRTGRAPRRRSRNGAAEIGGPTGGAPAAALPGPADIDMRRRDHERVANRPVLIQDGLQLHDAGGGWCLAGMQRMLQRHDDRRGHRCLGSAADSPAGGIAVPRRCRGPGAPEIARRAAAASPGEVPGLTLVLRTRRGATSPSS